MTDNWEEQLKGFVRRTGEELKRAGEEIKKEAGRLVTEVKDPERQKKVKDGLRELGHWAKKTAEEVGTMVEEGVKKAEGAFRQVTTAPTEHRPSPPPAPARRPAAPAQARSAKPPARGGGKSIGGKRAAKSRPSPAAAPKTIGRKRR